MSKDTGVQRDALGRYVAGTCGGPGRSRRKTEEQYLLAMSGCCGLQDWRDIVARAVADAKDGSASARSWLSNYLLGLPRAHVDAQITRFDPLAPEHIIEAMQIVAEHGEQGLVGRVVVGDAAIERALEEAYEAERADRGQDDADDMVEEDLPF